MVIASKNVIVSGKTELQRPKHLAYLDGLRAFAATYVVLHHATLQLTEPNVPVPGYFHSLIQLFIYGHYAVTVFIVLSGFCLMLPVVRRGELSGGAWFFFKKRAYRILPPYYLCMAVCLLLIHFAIGEPTRVNGYWEWNRNFWVWNLALPVSYKDVLLHAVMLHDLFDEPGHKINYVLWSVAVEWRIYFLFPALVYCWRRFGGWIVLAAMLPLAYLAEYGLQFTSLNATETGPCLHYFALFVVGMLAAEVSFSATKFQGAWDKVPWGFLALAAFAWEIVLTIKGGGHITWYVNDFFVAAWAALLLIAMSRKPSISGRLLSSRPVAFAGLFAYSIYLIHPPILQLVSQYIILPSHLSWMMASVVTLSLGTIASLLGAYVFYLCCERPFIQSKDKLKKST